MHKIRRKISLTLKIYAYNLNALKIYFANTY